MRFKVELSADEVQSEAAEGETDEVQSEVVEESGDEIQGEVIEESGDEVQSEVAEENADEVQNEATQENSQEAQQEEETETVISGTCGENLTWELKDGVLSITGTGEMQEYDFDEDDDGMIASADAPWYGQKDNITFISIGDGVTSIGYAAFTGLSNVTSVSIPNSVTSIGTYSFRGCSALTEVTIPNSVTGIGWGIFVDCSALTEVTIPDSVTSIGYIAFGGCSALTKVTIPNSVTYISGRAFENCSALTEVTIPSSVTYISGRAFANCNNLQSIKILNPKCEFDDNEDTISATATIYGYEGSTAQQYANEYNRTFKVISEEAETYTITYDANGGTNAPNAQTKEQDKDITLSTATPTRTGYTFQGWTTSKDATKAEYKAGATYSGNANVTLYAVWKVKDYAISYELNGGTNSTSNPASYNITSDQITFQAPTRKGYTFVNWYKDASFKTKKTIIKSGSTGKVTLYAKWKANSYKVKFNKNGGKGTMETLSCTYDTSKKLTANAFKRTGYTFVGWTKKKDGTGTVYKNKASIKNLTSTNGKTVTLYAKWKANTYKVSFNKNAKTAKGTMKTLSCTYDTSKKLTVNAFTRSGYKFAGWNTKANGKGTTYKNKASIKNLTSTSGKTVTLYAQWKKK